MGTVSVEQLTSAAYDRQRAMSYLALDVPTWEEAKSLVDQFDGVLDSLKVGLELFHIIGPNGVEELCKRGKRVFLDVKLHDIPNTVTGALNAICQLPIEMVNVHALGGRNMMEKAGNVVASSTGYRPILIAVTILTSLSDEALCEMGFSSVAADLVGNLARLTADCGLDGVVASGQEASAIRSITPEGFEIVVPGTRPPGANVGDQVRTMTPGRAVSEGATRLVLGRAVTQAENRYAALKTIWDDMGTALSEHQQP